MKKLSTSGKEFERRKARNRRVYLAFMGKR